MRSVLAIGHELRFSIDIKLHAIPKNFQNSIPLLLIIFIYLVLIVIFPLRSYVSLFKSVNICTQCE